MKNRIKGRTVIGTRIIVTRDIDGRIKKGMLGTILESTTDSMVSVELDVFFNGHNCNGLGQNGYCWNIYRDSMETYIVSNKSASSVFLHPKSLEEE